MALERNLKALFSYFGIGEYPPEYNPRIHGPYDPSRNYGKGKYIMYLCRLLLLQGQTNVEYRLWSHHHDAIIWATNQTIWSTEGVTKYCSGCSGRRSVLQRIQNSPQHCSGGRSQGRLCTHL